MLKYIMTVIFVVFFSMNASAAENVIGTHGIGNISRIMGTTKILEYADYGKVQVLYSEWVDEDHPYWLSVNLGGGKTWVGEFLLPMSIPMGSVGEPDIDGVEWIGKHGGKTIFLLKHFPGGNWCDFKPYVFVIADSGSYSVRDIDTCYFERSQFTIIDKDGKIKLHLKLDNDEFDLDL